jgi:hypothetical protein
MSQKFGMYSDFKGKCFGKYALFRFSSHYLRDGFQFGSLIIPLEEKADIVAVFA